MNKKQAVVKTNPNRIETETNRLDRVDMDKEMQYCMKKIPISQARIERIKDKIKTFLDENPNARSISRFYHSQDISAKTYYRLLERDPELLELHQMTMQKMGNKMYEDSVDYKANWNAVHFKIHQYAPEYKEAKEFNAQLSKKDEAVQQGPQFIVVKDFESSALVPERKKD